MKGKVRAADPAEVMVIHDDSSSSSSSSDIDSTASMNRSVSSAISVDTD